MTVTATDQFCGAGGSSLGAEQVEQVQVVMAMNHWQRAIEVHQSHFPNARHDCADVSQADPRRYPVTDILLTSPECTNHSQARGISRKAQNPTLWDAPDPMAERSRATMWDVVRFSEQIPYKAIVVENVVEATKWNLWPMWWAAMEANGYKGVVLSHNSMHHGVPQSRDRIYVVWTKGRLKVDLEMEHIAYCGRCNGVGSCRQAFKQGRRVGRYRSQWVWSCTTCHHPVEPLTAPASDIIDWSLPCPRIGDRAKPLAQNTRDRILAGLVKYGWAPVTTVGAGNGFERTPGNRARPLTEPVSTQTTTTQTALATPPAFLFQTAHGGRSLPLSAPHPTVCAADDRHGIVVPLRRNGDPSSTDQVVPTVTAGGNHHGLLMRNNMGGAEMITPVTEPARTLTTKGHQSLLTPSSELVDDCGFRMLEPYEVAAAMAFPPNYIDRTFPKKEQVKLAGNAVTPPVMRWIVGRIIQALEAG